jgi:hypothetical protein
MIFWSYSIGAIFAIWKGVSNKVHRHGNSWKDLRNAKRERNTPTKEFVLIEEFLDL